MNTAEQPPIPSKVFFETLDARGTAHVTGRASNGYGICSPYTPENTFIGISQDDLKEASVIYLQKLDINVRWTRNGFKDGRGCDYHIYKASLAPFDGGEAYVPAAGGDGSDDVILFDGPGFVKKSTRDFVSGQIGDLLAQLGL